MNEEFDSAIRDWAGKQRPNQARLNQIMAASRLVNDLDAQWWKSQFTVMRTALRVSQQMTHAHHFG